MSSFRVRVPPSHPVHVDNKSAVTNIEIGRPFPYSAGAGFEGLEPELVRSRNPLRGIYFAEELEPRQEAVRDLRKGHFPDIPKGAYYQDLLLAEYQRQTPLREHVCVIRFPPDIASLMHRRTRLQSAGHPLGLEIHPTAYEDFRVFDIRVLLYEGDKRLLNAIRAGETIDERAYKHIVTELDTPLDAIALRGLLLELPTTIDCYKYLPWDLEDGYKANSIKQMMFAWIIDEEVVDLSNFRPTESNKQFGQPFNWYTCPSGITPGSYNIVERKFRKKDTFTREELQLAELEILQLLYCPYRDLVLLLASTEWDMHKSLAELRAATAAGTEGVNVKGVVDIIRPEDNSIFDERPGGGWDSDLDSESFFSGHQFRKRFDDAGNESQEANNVPEVPVEARQATNEEYDLFDLKRS